MDLFGRQTLWGFSLLVNPGGCLIRSLSSKIPWHFLYLWQFPLIGNCQWQYKHIETNLMTEEKVSWYSTPSIWFMPLATNSALNLTTDPSTFSLILNNQIALTTLSSLCLSTKFQVWFWIIALHSICIASFHSGSLNA